MAVYFVDPTNGSNDNDGLTPGAALADIFKDVGAGAEDIPTFWIKRGETIVIAEAKVLNYGNVYAWPKSDATIFASRPQEGIDAGWDGDLVADPIIQTHSSSIVNINVSVLDLSNLHFIGVEFSLIDAGTLFQLQSARIIMDNCSFTGGTTSVYVFGYVAGSSAKQDENGIVELNNCSLLISDWESTSSAMFYFTPNVDLNYKHEIFINNSTFNGIGTFIYAITNSHTRYLKAFIENSNIRASAFFSRTSNDGGTKAQYVYLTINNTDVYSVEDNFEIGYSTTYCLRTFHLTTNNSHFVSGGHTLDEYHSQNSNSCYSVLDVICQGSSFQSLGFFRNYAYNKVRVNNLDIRGCTFRNMENVFYFYGLYSVTKFNFVNNILDEVGMVVNCSSNTSYAARCKFNISLKGQSVATSLINVCDGGYIYIEDCNIGKELCQSNTANLNIVAVNSNFDAIRGNYHHVSLRSCRLESPTTPALPDCTGASYDSQIISEYHPLLGPKSNFLFNRCNITTPKIIIPERENVAKMVDCVFNGVPTPLKEVNGVIKKEITPIYRVGGSPFSLSLTTIAIDSQTRTVAGDVYCAHNIAKPTVSIYMNSVFDIATTNVVTLKASFIADGLLKVVDMDIVVDPSSQWDGVQASNTPYYATINLSTYNIASGSKVTMLISMSNAGGETTSLNIDTKLGQE